ncbi:SH3-like domain-containing protein [Rhizobiales bacterium GAS191]|nr:SH3-like domain-containing protein [Rhizobiales bacterium GAS191]
MKRRSTLMAIAGYALIGLALGTLMLARPAAAAGDEPGIGPVSKLPMPRYVSLKADSVNLREGPNRDHPVKWIFKRAGLPVEITAEFEQWVRIRDSDGTEGWVLHNLLSARRTALVAPWSKEASIPLFERPDAGSSVVAKLQPRVLASVRDCSREWCRLKGDKFDGYMQEDKLWGVYPRENVE